MSKNATINEPPRRQATFVSSKIKEEHLQLGAALYVRQSTSQQLRDHQESTARQYALKDRLLTLGWREDQVIVLDEDLGISASGRAERPGFRRLLKLVTDQHVGIVLGLEMSRLARNSRDWHDLFEVCAIFNTLIADEDGVFDPNDPNDRMVLGMKGIISEMELHTMKVRLERGRLNKAHRGELFHHVPVGYVLDEAGLPQLDPDESARHVMRIFFELFETLGSSNALFRHLAEHNIKLPFRDNCRDRSGGIDWRVPAKTTVYDLLKHPLYSGTYGYGLQRNYSDKMRKHARKKHLPPEQWKVWLKDRHPAYITWDQYENNQARLRENDNRGDRSGPVRGGSALLGGLVFCAHCGRRMWANYGPNSRPSYYCGRHHTVACGEPCYSTLRCGTLDELVSAKLLEVLAPAGVDLSLQVIEDEQVRREQLDTLQEQRVEQRRYAVDLTERRYKAVDPANRLVAGTLEHEWELSLAELELATTGLEQLRSKQPLKLCDAERHELQSTCGSVASLWRERMTINERKQIVRLLLRRIEVDVHHNTERVSLRLHWSGGFESCHEITRYVPRFVQLESYDKLIDRALELTLAGARSPQVASALAREGFHSPRSSKPLSSDMVKILLKQDPRSHQQLTDPPHEQHHWRSADLAKKLGIPEKRLKHWVTRRWATATQRPFGHVWIIYASKQELQRLHRLASSQTGQGSPGPSKKLRTPTPIPRKTP